MQCQLQLGGAEGTLRHHEFRFRVPVLLPLFLMPHSVTATMSPRTRVFALAGCRNM